MSFIDINSLVKFKNLKGKSKIAKVIDNNDPGKKGRIKVSLQGMFDPTDETGTNLPWVRQRGFSFKGVNQLYIPEVGSYVEIVWPFGSRTPMYQPAPYESNGFGNEFNSGYPNEWGWADSGGFVFKIDKNINSFIIKTKNFSMDVDVNGACVIKNNSAQVEISSAGEIKITGGNIRLSGTTTIEGKKFMEHTHSNGHQGANTGGVV